MNYRGGMWEGGGGQDGVEWGGEWDNCNSIINKYIKKTTKKELKNFWLSARSVSDNNDDVILFVRT